MFAVEKYQWFMRMGVNIVKKSRKKLVSWQILKKEGEIFNNIMCFHINTSIQTYENIEPRMPAQLCLHSS